MTQATTKDYWISPTALYIELNALGNPNYIQASCISGAQILVYVKDIIGFDAGHNYRRWPLQAAPTVFNSNTEKYVYAAIPRDMTLTASAWIVFPSEQIDIYGKNKKEEQVGDEKYYYIFLQGIITSSGDNGTVQRDWKIGGRIVFGYLSSDEAISAIPYESEWYDYNYADGIVTFLKNITMNAGTVFRQFFVNTLTIMQGGKLSFDEQKRDIIGVADDITPVTSNNKIVTPDYLGKNALSRTHRDTAQEVITFEKGWLSGRYAEGVSGAMIDGDGNMEAESLRLRRGLTVGGDLVIGRDTYIKRDGTSRLGDVELSGVRSKGVTSADRTLIGGKGFELYKDGSGKSHLYVDNAVVRGKLLAAETEIRKVSYSGGTLLLSNAGSRIVKVSALGADGGVVGDGAAVAWKCWAAADDGTTQTMNWWKVGDMAMCRTFNVSGSTGGNRYYWRLVVGRGQEVLDDGKLYDYVVLSNVARFAGGDAVSPVNEVSTLADGNGNVVTWGGVAVTLVTGVQMTGFAAVVSAQDGTDKDDGGVLLTGREFYGFDPQGTDEPCEGDVIVQAGSQTRFVQRGNIIKIATSADDGDARVAPSLTMYHQMGNTWSTDDGGVDVWQWKTVTAFISPTGVRFNADYFKWFSGSEDNVVDPVAVRYDVVPSSAYIVRHVSTQDAEPDDVTFSVWRYVGGNAAEDWSGKVTLRADYNLSDGTHGVKTISKVSDIGALFDLSRLSVTAVAADGTALGKTDIAIVADGAQGAPGKPGSDGTPGSDGLTVTATPAVIVLKAVKAADGSYKVQDYSLAKAQITVSRGGKDVTAQCALTAVRGVNCTASVSGQTVSVTTVSQQTIDGMKIPYTDGSVTVTGVFADDGTTVPLSISIAVKVEVGAVWGGIEAGMSQLSSRYTELSDTVDGMPLKTDGKLLKYTSEITQSAREIALKVGQTAVGRKNLLVGSALRRQGEGMGMTALGESGIERLGGVDGMNCWHGVSAAQETVTVGMDAATGGYNVRLEKGKKYTMSAWVKVTDARAVVFYRVGFRASADSTTDVSTLTDHVLTTTEKTSAWQLVTWTWEMPQSVSASYARVLYGMKNGTAGTSMGVWVCQPMLQEGDGYNGWGLSEQDYKYVGGNMLGNTRTLEKSGNMVTRNGTVTAEGYGGCATIEATADTDYIDMLQWKAADGFALNEDYTLSFMAKGSGRISGYMYHGTGIKMRCENSDGLSRTDVGDGSSAVTLTSEWRRYWIHWRNKGTGKADYMLLRLLSGGTATIAQPKLEVGANVTDWLEGSETLTEDRSTEARLLDTGIDIRHREVDITADRFTLRNNAGERSMDVDSDGNVVARSLQSVSRDGKLTVTVRDGAFIATTTNSLASAFIGLVDGMPRLQFTNALGVVTYSIGATGPSAVGDGTVTKIEGRYTVMDLEAVAPTNKNYSVMYNVGVTYKNVTGSTINIMLSQFSLSISGFTGELTATASSATVGGETVTGSRPFAVNPNQEAVLKFSTSEAVAKYGAGGIAIARPSGAVPCKVTVLVGSNTANGLIYESK